MAHPPSPQQRAVYKWVREGSGNLILIAVAGAGKTTTILNCACFMTGDVAMAAYNSKIAKEIGAKLRSVSSAKHVQSGTFHSFGLRNWQKHTGKVYTTENGKLDPKKIRKIVESQKQIKEPMQEFVCKLVSMAKQRGIGFLEHMNDEQAWLDMVEHYDLDDALPEDHDGDMVGEGIALATGVLYASADRDEDVIDFDDMLYAPLYHGSRIWQNDGLLVDEAQDLNPVRRELARKMLSPSGRAIFVGDPAQAIYGFTGADNDSLEIIEREFKCQKLLLTVTFRCPKAVVDVARQYVSHITAADTAPEGVVSSIRQEDFAKLNGDHINASGAMLCRCTAPLVKEAFGLIRRGIPCHVEGKEIGQGLINLTRKWKTNSLMVLIDKLMEFKRKEVEKFLLAKQDDKAEALSDKIDTLLVIAEDLPDDATVNALRAKITGLFGDTPEGQRPPHFTLSTVHKSKGREWQTVYILDRAKLMPSKFARQDWQKEQEKNLIYVAVTRSQGTLIEVST